jgi:hypothetical protein
MLLYVKNEILFLIFFLGLNGNFKLVFGVKPSVEPMV